MANLEDLPKKFENVLLLSPGEWNGNNFSSQEIHKAFENTDWSRRRKQIALYLDHQDTKGRGVETWAGFVKNPRMNGDELIGDLEVWHPHAATALTVANMPLGVSATLEGFKNRETNEIEKFKYESFSLVIDPACEPAMVNLRKEKAVGDRDKNLVRVTLGKLEPSKNVKKIKEDNFELQKTEEDHIKKVKGGKKVMSEEEKKKNLEQEEVAQEEKEEETDEEVKKEEEPSEKPKESEKESEKVEESEETDEEEEEEELTKKEVSELNSKLDKLLALLEKSMSATKPKKEETETEKLQKEVTSIKKELSKLQEVPERKTFTLSVKEGEKEVGTERAMLRYLNKLQ